MKNEDVYHLLTKCEAYKLGRSDGEKEARKSAYKDGWQACWVTVMERLGSDAACVIGMEPPAVSADEQGET